MVVASSREPEMKITEIRELAATDLDLVSGGMDSNFKFCWNGPAGTGTYPLYADCRSGTEKLIDAFLEGVEQGRKKGQRPQ
jgi:hypothetical protein